VVVASDHGRELLDYVLADLPDAARDGASGRQRDAAPWHDA
jgi:hypothetical protein